MDTVSQPWTICAIIDSYDVEPVHVNIKIGWRHLALAKIIFDIRANTCESLHSLCNKAVGLASFGVPDATQTEKTALAMLGPR
jgi:hypothetical protein